MKWSWRRSFCAVSMLMVLRGRQPSNSVPSCLASWDTMSSLRLNLELERRQLLPFLSCSKLTWSWTSVRRSFSHLLASWLSKSRRWKSCLLQWCTFDFNWRIFRILQVVLALGDYMDAQCHACIGGTNVREDLRKLSQGVHVVVGTPGRVFDMINRRALSMLTRNC